MMMRLMIANGRCVLEVVQASDSSVMSIAGMIGCLEKHIDVKYAQDRRQEIAGVICLCVQVPSSDEVVSRMEFLMNALLKRLSLSEQDSREWYTLMSRTWFIY